MTSSSLSPSYPPPNLVDGAATETQGLLAVNDQDGEDDDVPDADDGFFVDDEIADEDDGLTSQSKSTTTEEKSKEAHDVKFKASPCRPNSVEVAKHDKTHTFHTETGVLYAWRQKRKKTRTCVKRRAGTNQQAFRSSPWITSSCGES